MENFIGTNNGRNCRIGCRTNRLVALAPYTGRCLRCRGHGTAYLPAITACNLRIQSIEQRGETTSCLGGGSFSSAFSKAFDIGE